MGCDSTAVTTYGVGEIPQHMTPNEAVHNQYACKGLFGVWFYFCPLSPDSCPVIQGLRPAKADENSIRHVVDTLIFDAPGRRCKYRVNLRFRP
jgi:hypothetical protein